jgi:imidazolonepropionase
MCFADRREEEFSLRINGTSYLDILAKGGGILSSVRSVRAAEPKQLFTYTYQTVTKALSFGTTTLEIKSGYGLDLENELKMLAVIGELDRKTCLDVVATFLGAHAIPKEYKTNPDGFVEELIETILPAVKDQGIARFCDVFCEKGIFSIDQSRKILQAALVLGLKLKLHADEVQDLGGGRLAAELGAISADHLLATSPDSIAAMRQAGTIGILLPATAFSLKKGYAPARKMIESGLPLALATDCNPGSSFTESIPFVIGLSIMNMDLTPYEALTASTLNGAYAISMADRVGSLDIGKQADFLLLDGQSPAILAYHAGVSPVTAVYKKGEKVA